MSMNRRQFLQVFAAGAATLAVASALPAMAQAQAQDEPWTMERLNRAIRDAAPGDTIAVTHQGGEPLVLEGMLDILDKTDIRLVAEGNVVIDATGERNAMRIFNSDHIQLTGGWTFANADGAGITISKDPRIDRLQGGPGYGIGSNIVLDGVTVENNGQGFRGNPSEGQGRIGGSGIYAGGNNIVIVNSRIRHNGEHGIYVFGDDITVMNNIIESNGSVIEGQEKGVGIRAEGRNNSFVNNLIAGNLEGGIGVWTDFVAFYPNDEHYEEARAHIEENRDFFTESSVIQGVIYAPMVTTGMYIHANEIAANGHSNIGIGNGGGVTDGVYVHGNTLHTSLDTLDEELRSTLDEAGRAVETLSQIVVFDNQLADNTVAAPYDTFGNIVIQENILNGDVLGRFSPASPQEGHTIGAGPGAIPVLATANVVTAEQPFYFYDNAPVSRQDAIGQGNVLPIGPEQQQEWDRHIDSLRDYLEESRNGAGQQSTLPAETLTAIHGATTRGEFINGFRALFRG